MQLWIVEHFFLHKKVPVVLNFLQNPYFSLAVNFWDNSWNSNHIIDLLQKVYAAFSPRNNIFSSSY